MTSDRDFTAEFRAYVEAALPQSADFVLATVAGELVQKLRLEDPDLLRGWLDMRAAAIVTDYIGTVERGQRARATRERPVAAFKDAAEKLAAGDPEPMAIFREHLVVSAENLRRPIGDMTKGDHLFVAAEHTSRSNAALFEAAFHKAVAKKIPNGKTTKDVLSEEDYLRLRNSIRPRTSASAA